MRARSALAACVLASLVLSIDVVPSSASERAVQPTSANATRPSVVGRPTFGNVVRVRIGASGAGTASSFRVRWQRCNERGSRCRNVPRAGASAYRIRPADIGRRLRVVITTPSSARMTSRPTTVVRIPVTTPVRATASKLPRPAAGVAHLWVDAQQAGSCTRSRTPSPFNAAASCATPGAAYNTANASREASTVRIRAGDYSHLTFTLVGNRTSPTWITFEPDTGVQVAFKGIQLGVGSDGTGPSLGPDYVALRSLHTTFAGSDDVEPENRRGLAIFAGSTHIRVEHVRAGSHFLQGAQDVEILNSEFGPCRAGASNSGPTPRACANNMIDHWGARPVTGDRQSRRILLQGNYYHDYQLGRSCFSVAAGGTNTGNPACHWECMFLNGVSDLTIRGNTFRDCAIMGIFTEDTQGVGYQNVTIESNSFGTPLNYPQGYDAIGSHARPDALSVGCKSGHPGYRGLMIRLNSFAHNTGMDFYFDGCQTARNISVIGNIAAKGRCPAPVSFRFNVWNQGAGLSGTCHRTDVNLGGARFPFYASDTVAPTPRSYVLAPMRSPADNRVPVVAGCAATDQRGRPRGFGGRCDAGSHER